MPDHAALLVIDMQDEFVRSGWMPYWIPDAIRQVPRLARLLASCPARRVPVLYLAFAATHCGLDRPRSGTAMPSRNPQLGADDPAWLRDGRIRHELAPERGEVIIHKPSYGAFYDTPLATALRNLGRDTVRPSPVGVRLGGGPNSPQSCCSREPRRSTRPARASG